MVVPFGKRGLPLRNSEPLGVAFHHDFAGWAAV
jgi:hypothetical protein